MGLFNRLTNPKTPKNVQKGDKKRDSSVHHQQSSVAENGRELKKNHSTNDILDQNTRNKHSKMAQELRGKDEKLASISVELERFQVECKQLRRDNDGLTGDVKKLKNEIAAQELLVRLERGDFEELKAKESSYHQLVKDNKKLREKIKILEADSSRHAELKQTKEKLRATIDEANRAHAKLEKERAEARKDATDLEKENKLIQQELKNALRAQSDMEKSLQKIQASESKMTSDRDDELEELRATVTTLERKLADSKTVDLAIRSKDQEIASLKATIDSLNLNDRNKDEIIVEKEQSIQNLRYKLKDAQETYESQWEEMMMMTERQLKAVRAEKTDTSATKQLKSEIRSLQTKLQNKEDEKSTLNKELTDLKRKLRNADAENRVPKAKYDEAVRELTDKVSNLDERLKDESYSRVEEKRIAEQVIQNLQGHMINIYTGNIPTEMAKMLDTIVKIKLANQT